MKKINEEKKSKKNLIEIIILIILSIGLIIGFFLTYRNYKNNYEYKFELSIKELKVKLNEEIDPEKYIKTQKNVDVKYNIITTHTIGKRYLTYRVLDKFNRVHYYYIDVYVVDDVAPTIEGKDKVTLYVDSKIDLKSYVKVSDNLDKDLEIKTEGEVDTSKEGVYKVKYTTSDKSGNTAEHTIEFTVKKKEVYVAPPVENGTVGTTSKGYKIENKGGATYINGILIASKTYNLSSTYGNGLTSATKSAFNELNSAAEADGFSFRIGSGYRSYNSQKSIYNGYVKRDGQTKADTYSARPGHSEHQSGLAIDICSNHYKERKYCIGSAFNNTPDAKWLSDNAYKYGFILRYPSGKTSETGYKYESWHFRYVGKELAATLYNVGDWITLESYLGITSKYSE